MSLGCLAPRPDVQLFLQKKEREEREKREGKDDRSFFQKYVRLYELCLLWLLTPHPHPPTHPLTHTVGVHCGGSVHCDVIKWSWSGSRRAGWRGRSLGIAHTAVMIAILSSLESLIYHCGLTPQLLWYYAQTITHILMSQRQNQSWNEASVQSVAHA